MKYDIINSFDETDGMVILCSDGTLVVEWSMGDTPGPTIAFASIGEFLKQHGPFRHLENGEERRYYVEASPKDDSTVTTLDEDCPGGAPMQSVVAFGVSHLLDELDDLVEDLDEYRQLDLFAALTVVRSCF